MTERRLAMLMGENLAGQLFHAQGRTRLVYDSAWRGDPQAHPLSLSLPLAQAEHPADAVEPVLWGLLPDNEQVLARWGSRFGVSPRNVFALLEKVGADCAGAVRFLPSERVAVHHEGDIEWLADNELQRRLRDLRLDPSAGRRASDSGQFSLAGAQPKVALIRQNHRWGVPWGAVPTTHIIKPALPSLPGHPENEHLCLTLARALGLRAVRSEVGHFGTEVAIVIQRYDRLPDDSAPGGFLRVHQEDLCQALSLSPGLKYQNDGGPSPAQILALIQQHSSAWEEDRATFLDALGFNWLIGAPDAHAKNYSLLLAGEGQVRLAPLYDIASALPYPEMDPRRLKLAMKIGSSYELDSIDARQWRRLAESIGYPPGALIERLCRLALALPGAVERVWRQAGAQGLDHPIIAVLGEKLLARAAVCRRLLGLED